MSNTCSETKRCRDAASLLHLRWREKLGACEQIALIFLTWPGERLLQAKRANDFIFSVITGSTDENKLRKSSQ